MTTFALSSWNAGWWHGDGLEAALALAFFYGGMAQLLAGMWEFVRKNTFAALAFTSYGAFWLSFYALIKFNIPGGGSDTVPIFLLGWAIFTVYMTLAATKTNNAVLTVFVLLSITFILAHHRKLGNDAHLHRHHQGGWMRWSRHRGGGVVRVRGGGRERHARQSCVTGRSTRLT